MLQTVTRKDLADPILFGQSSGAATGAVAVIIRCGERLGVWTLPMATFIDAAHLCGAALLVASDLATWTGLGAQELPFGIVNDEAGRSARRRALASCP